MSVIVNMLGGSGLGKSTTAALVFGELKLQGQSAELVTEYAKEWAWAGRRIQPEDQQHLLETQSAREALLYNKVDFIVTDSPLILGAVYQKFYTGADPIYQEIQKHMQEAEAQGCIYQNFLLKRNKSFNPAGRFETEEQARAVDEVLKRYLDHQRIPYQEILTQDRQRVTDIVEHLMRNNR